MEPFTTQVVLEDRLHPNDAISFCKDKMSNALEMLREKHNGRCFPGGYFVVNVAEIQYASPVFIERNDLDAKSMVDCTFKADVKVYKPGDIIPIVPIRHLGTTLEGVVGELNITLYENPLFSALKEGQRIACVIKAVRTNQNRENVSILAEIYKPVSKIYWLLSESQEPEIFKVKKLDSDIAKLFFTKEEDSKGEKKRCLVYSPLEGTLRVDKVVPGSVVLGMTGMDQIRRVIMNYENLIAQNEKYWKSKNLKTNQEVWDLYNKN